MHYERLECLFFVSSIAYFKSNFRRGLRRVLVRFKMNFHVNNFIYKCSTIVLLRLLTLLNVGLVYIYIQVLYMYQMKFSPGEHSIP